MNEFESVIEALFDEFVPGRTYKIVNDMPTIPGVSYPVLVNQLEHISAFSSADAEYMYKAVVYHFMVRSNGYPPFVFRQIVNHVLTTKDYSGQLSMSFGILWALLVVIPRYEKESKTTVLDQADFISMYINYFGDADYTTTDYHRRHYGQDCSTGSSVPAELHFAA